jgi:hypothetical protein
VRAPPPPPPSRGLARCLGAPQGAERGHGRSVPLAPIHARAPASSPSAARGGAACRRARVRCSSPHNARSPSPVEKSRKMWRYQRRASGLRTRFAAWASKHATARGAQIYRLGRRPRVAFDCKEGEVRGQGPALLALHEHPRGRARGSGHPDAAAESPRGTQGARVQRGSRAAGGPGPDRRYAAPLPRRWRKGGRPGQLNETARAAPAAHLCTRGRQVAPSRALQNRRLASRGVIRAGAVRCKGAAGHPAAHHAGPAGGGEGCTTQAGGERGQGAGMHGVVYVWANCYGVGARSRAARFAQRCAGKCRGPRGARPHGRRPSAACGSFASQVRGRLAARRARPGPDA